MYFRIYGSKMAKKEECRIPALKNINVVEKTE
jgi:hypothetical protein